MPKKLTLKATGVYKWTDIKDGHISGNGHNIIKICMAISMADEHNTITDNPRAVVRIGETRAPIVTQGMSGT